MTEQEAFKEAVFKIKASCLSEETKNYILNVNSYDEIVDKIKAVTIQHSFDIEIFRSVSIAMDGLDIDGYNKRTKEFHEKLVILAIDVMALSPVPRKLIECLL